MRSHDRLAVGLARASRAACAAGTFSSLPIHVTMHVFWRALPNENESDLREGEGEAGREAGGVYEMGG